MRRCGTQSSSVSPSRAVEEYRTAPSTRAAAASFLGLPDLAHAAIAAHLPLFDVLRVSICCKATGLVYMATISGAKFVQGIQPRVLVSLMTRLRGVKVVKLDGQRGLECFLAALEQTEGVWASVERLETRTESTPSLSGATARVPSLKELELSAWRTPDWKQLAEALGDGAWRHLSSLKLYEEGRGNHRRPLGDYHALADGLEKRVRRGLPGITGFALSGSKWSFTDLQQLLVGGKGCTSLQSLDLCLYDKPAPDVVVVAAYLASSNSAHLRELSLEAEGPLDSVVIEIGQGRRPLTSLRLVEGTIGGHALQSLADGVARHGVLKELQYLSLVRLGVGQGGWVGLFEAVGRSHGWSNVRKLCLESMDEEDGLIEGFASSVKHGAFSALQDVQLLLCGALTPLAEALKHNQVLARGLRSVEIMATYVDDTGYISDWAKAFEVDGQFVDGLKKLWLCDVDGDSEIDSPKDADMQALATMLVRGFGRHLEELRLPIRASTARALCDALLACAWTELKVLELSIGEGSEGGYGDGDADEDGGWNADAVEALACLLGGRGATPACGGPGTVEGQPMARSTRVLTSFPLDATIFGHDNVSVLLDALAAPTAVRLQTLDIKDLPKDERLWDHLLNVLVGDAGSNLQTITIVGKGVPTDWLLRIATAIRADKKVLPALVSVKIHFDSSETPNVQRTSAWRAY